MSRIASALAVVVLGAGLGAAQGSESPLVVEVTTDRDVYRARRLVRITLTETNTSDHGVDVTFGCQILQAHATAQDGSVVWVFRDHRLCSTGQGTLAGRASRTFEIGWNTKRSRRGRLGVIRVPPGEYTITAGVDGVSDSTVVRLRRRK